MNTIWIQHIFLIAEIHLNDQKYFIGRSWRWRWQHGPLPMPKMVCGMIGVIYAAGEKTTMLTPQTRLLLTTGICGGFTTFSTFAFENMNLLRSGDISYFLLYALGSMLSGILLVFAGVALIKLF